MSEERQQGEHPQERAAAETPAATLPPVDQAPEVEPEKAYCPQCGTPMLATDRYCNGCGWDAQTHDQRPSEGAGPRQPPPTPRRTAPPSDFNRLTTFLLCLLLGFLGVHRFYVGRVGSGIVWLLTGGVLAVGWIYDLVMIATGEFQDEQGKRVVYWQ